MLGRALDIHLLAEFATVAIIAAKAHVFFGRSLSISGPGFQSVFLQRYLAHAARAGRWHWSRNIVQDDASSVSAVAATWGGIFGGAVLLTELGPTSLVSGAAGAALVTTAGAAGAARVTTTGAATAAMPVSGVGTGAAATALVSTAGAAGAAV